MLGCCKVREPAHDLFIPLCVYSENQLLVAMKSFTERKCPGFGSQKAKRKSNLVHTGRSTMDTCIGDHL